MKIDDLVNLTGQPRRNIRFLIAQGVVPEPYSRGRGASYGPEHLNCLLLYANLKAQGITSLDVIRDRIQSADVGGPLVISTVPGVEISIERSVLEQTDIETLLQNIGDAVRRAFPSSTKVDQT